jgi:hypothetical protein
MISEEDVEKVAGNTPEQTFYRVEALARKRLEDAYRSAKDEPPFYSEFDYANTVLAAAKAFGIPELAGFELPEPYDSNSDSKCREFRARATLVSNHLMFSTNYISKSVALNGPTKHKISHWLEQIRGAVQQAEISKERKDPLLALVNKLQMEIDRERTSLHAAGEVWLTICTYAGQGAQRLEAALQAIERVGAALGVAKDTEAVTSRLPPTRDPKRIEPPKKKMEFEKDLDDEIPF